MTNSTHLFLCLEHLFWQQSHQRFEEYGAKFDHKVIDASDPQQIPQLNGALYLWHAKIQADSNTTKVVNNFHF